MKVINTFLINPLVESVIVEYKDDVSMKKLVIITNIYSKTSEFRVYSGYSAVSGWASIVTKHIFGEAVECYNKS